MFGKRSHPGTSKDDREFKRSNKNRPREMSSKQPVSPLMDVFQVKKKHKRDPRFDDLSGVFMKNRFEENYSFLKEIKQKEKEDLKKELEHTTSKKRKQQIHSILMRMKNQEVTEKLNKEKEQREKEKQQAVVDSLKEGRKPFFIKKSQEKKQKLVERFQELSKSGKLDKYLERKRKKQFSKDRRKFCKR